MLVTTKTDLERFVVCSETDAWYILQPNWEATTKLHRNRSQYTGVLHIHQNWRTVIPHYAEVISRNGGIPKIPLAANVGTDAEMCKQPGLLDSLYEPDQIVPVFEIVLREKIPSESCMTHNDNGMKS